MKTTATAVFGGTMFIAAGANAAFMGIGWEDIANGGAADRTIDFYAMFDSGGDQATAVAGTVVNNLSIRVFNGTFYQDPFDAAGAGSPSGSFIPLAPTLAFDTFLSIGALVSQGDETSFTPGFPAFSSTEIGGTQDENSDNQDDGDNMVWSVTPDAAQSFAGNSVIGGNRVLLGRLSANALGPAGIEFVANFTLQGVADGAGFEENVSFSTVPAPGALALLGLAGLAGTRRRRAF